MYCRISHLGSQNLFTLRAALKNILLAHTKVEMGWVRLFFPPQGISVKLLVVMPMLISKLLYFVACGFTLKTIWNYFLRGCKFFLWATPYPTYVQTTYVHSRHFFLLSSQTKIEMGWSRYFQGISMKHSLMLSIRILKLYFAAVGFSRSTTWNNFLLGNAVMCFLFGQHVHRSKKNIWVVLQSGYTECLARGQK